MNMTDNTERKK